MRKAYIISIIVALVHTHAVIAAQDCNGLSVATCQQRAGCGWDGSTCSPCPDGTFGPANTTYCSSCDGAYPHSAPGSTAQTQCYKECKEQTIANGKFKVAYYNNECVYNISNIECDDGYSKNTEISELTSINHDLICVTNLLCKDHLDNCDGEITGSIHPTGTRDGGWNYNECRCTQKAPKDLCLDKETKEFKPYCDEGDMFVGTGESICTHRYNGNSWEKLDCQQDYVLQSCIAGYCDNSGSSFKCTEVREGWYSDGVSADITIDGITRHTVPCHACPTGSTTSGTGSESINDCHTDGGTEFCDKNGCFNIPGTYSVTN